MSRHDLYTGQILSEIQSGQAVSQRVLSRKLGIALGLTNLLMRRLVKKGWIKVTHLKANRVSYLITPAGVMEKARLTYEFVDYSLQLYREARQHLCNVLEPHVRAGCRRFAIYGTGEPAELTYISLRDLGLEPVCIFGDKAAGHRFLGVPVRPIASHVDVEYDLMIVATLEDARPLVNALVGYGLALEKICTLRPPQSSAPLQPARISVVQQADARRRRRG